MSATRCFSPFNLIDRLTLPPLAPTAAYSHSQSHLQSQEEDPLGEDSLDFDVTMDDLQRHRTHTKKLV